MEGRWRWRRRRQHLRELEPRRVQEEFAVATRGHVEMVEDMDLIHRLWLAVGVRFGVAMTGHFRTRASQVSWAIASITTRRAAPAALPLAPLAATAPV